MPLTASIVAPFVWWTNRNTPFALPARVAVVIATGSVTEPPLADTPTVAS